MKSCVLIVGNMAMARKVWHNCERLSVLHMATGVNSVIDITISRMSVAARTFQNGKHSLGNTTLTKKVLCLTLCAH
jgi:hypothetical protein